MNFSENTHLDAIIKQLMQLSSVEEKALYLEKVKNELSAEERKQLSQDLKVSTNFALQIANNTITLNALNDVKRYLSIAQIAEEYFGKTRGWLHQRINNYQVNGKSVYFQPQELKTLAKALDDIGNRLKETALKIKQTTGKE